MKNAVFVIGVLMLSAGVFMLSIPAGLIVSGGIMIAVSILVEIAKKRSSK